MISLKPGMTPLPIVLGYFIIAGIIAGLIVWKGKPRFTTLDLVYIGIGGAFVAIADHTIGDMIFLPNGIYPIINPPFWFRIITSFIVIALVRKVGSGMAVFTTYDLISDILHFGFEGEPLWLIEDALTYGLFMDVAIFLTKGNLFGVLESDVSRQSLKAIVEGILLGFAFSFVHPFFTYGFIAPLIHGFIPSQERVLYLFITYMASSSIISPIASLLALRVSRVISV
ncbi:hypothetical protein [Stygiolobus azoricus]|uniref:Uncharacterized protein n=1 Tax=Stygiolobus azoricus TaxID=41675 RepID=A0A650CPJ5_9CREN|nr:hypothetical protein [Stygiolobus azoricus]QGR19708.1 hypothetical protein D1868_06670 [Stygiolobus azoricus]